MSVADFDSILGSLIELTRQRDRHALEVCLAQVLFDVAAPGIVRLYRVREAEDGPAFVPVAKILRGENDGSAEEEQIPQSLSTAMQGCFKSRQAVTVPLEGEKGMVYPLLGVKNNVVALIVIEAAREDGQLSKAVDMVLEIYQNFLALINDNERDALTGLLNRKTFDAKTNKAIAEVMRLGHRAGDAARREYCVSILDIDHFKRVNDKFGHLYGDEVLLLLATLMTDIFRESDQLYRYGGEEFVVLLRDVGLQQALHVLDRFREKVKEYNFPQVGQITVSIGVTQVLATDTPPTLIDRADAALYYAKSHGRNQVLSHEQLVADGKLQSRP
jgi:diguanylate cyclase (GGDEF)-like protein